MTQKRYYITTPIYYVNDRPHIGHVYSTTIADILARCHRLKGDDVFFLTGTDEHAAKVVDAAAERGMTPQAWADLNAKQFQDTFERLGISNTDFIRTSQDRHKRKVVQYIRQLIASGDVYVGEYEGWYDTGQEEYLPENKAAEYDYKSPINGKPLVRKKEKNDFFALKKYQEPLRELIQHKNYILPAARRNEILARIDEGLHDVPISRTGARGWGIAVPDDPEQTIYVWIDALFNYISAIDNDEHRYYWPAQVHLIAKDILWFHAVIWPAMLMALGTQPGMDWLTPPNRVYAHSFWISEGQKMSKSLGNFIDLEKIDQYVETFGLDALRYYLATQGPMGTTDSDFSEAKFIDVYNADLANTLGNCSNRISNMTKRYFNSCLPEPCEPGEDDERITYWTNHVQVTTNRSIREAAKHLDELDLNGLCDACLSVVRAVDRCIDQTEPFKLARQKENLPAVGTVLYTCAEALRIAALWLWPVMPGKMGELLTRLGCAHQVEALADNGVGQLDRWTAWGGLKPGTELQQAEALFPRHQPVDA